MLLQIAKKEKFYKIANFKKKYDVIQNKKLKYTNDSKKKKQ